MFNVFQQQLRIRCVPFHSQWFHITEKMSGLDASPDYLNMIGAFRTQGQLLQSLASSENLVKGYGRPGIKHLLPIDLEKDKTESCGLLGALWCGNNIESGQDRNIGLLSQRSKTLVSRTQSGDFA